VAAADQGGARAGVATRVSDADLDDLIHEEW